MKKKTRPLVKFAAIFGTVLSLFPANAALAQTNRISATGADILADADKFKNPDGYVSPVIVTGTRYARAEEETTPQKLNLDPSGDFQDDGTPSFILSRSERVAANLVVVGAIKAFTKVGSGKTPDEQYRATLKAPMAAPR